MTSLLARWHYGEQVYCSHEKWTTSPYGSTGGTDGPLSGTSATALVHLLISGWPAGFQGLEDVDSFTLQGTLQDDVESVPGINQVIDEDLSILFPVFVTGGVKERDPTWAAFDLSSGYGLGRRPESPRSSA